MKKLLPVIGAGLTVGGVAMIIYLFSSKKKECNYKEPKKEESLALDITLTKAEEPEYKEAKRSAIGNLYSRHEGAATTIRDVVEIIRGNVKISENINNEIHKVTDELDKILSEG